MNRTVTIRRTGAKELARDRALLVLVYVVAFAAASGVSWALRDRHPILVVAAADVVATLVVFGASFLADNSSIYDPYWSVAPVPIAIYWAMTSGDGGSSLRSAWVIAVVCAWAVRLTANQLARWQGLEHEDFRYVELRARSGSAYWPLSLLGIHLMPTMWVFLGLLPIYPALAGSGRPWNAVDLAACAVAGGAVALEAIADRQLRQFRRRRRDPQDVLRSGVWRWSRHPNYLGEMLFWWGLWLSGVAAAPGWAWTAIGPLAITTLFVFVSVPWMDRHMAARHPAFAGHLRATPGLLPWPRPRR
ncbi:MAG TPA: DUF1295 domain-containing protein [Anaeromyxobacteraceae bacterium]|nr:DUF1295 domain-containing protein [Anaeromyxobacteraceae bacterium]